MAWRRFETRLDAPFPFRIPVCDWGSGAGRPLDLPRFGNDFERACDQPVPFVEGGNGAGKSTCVAALSVRRAVPGPR